MRLRCSCAVLFAGLFGCAGEGGASDVGTGSRTVDPAVAPEEVARAADAAGADDGGGEPQDPAHCVPPRLFGHRGTILFAPENTLPAYEYAIDSGGDGIEVDLHLTADGVLVAMHDATLARTTDGGDVAVGDVTAAYLAKLDAGAWFAPEFTGARVPTLDQVLDRFEPGPGAFLFDIKEEAAVDPLADAVSERALSLRSIVSSTSLSVLRRFQERLPEVEALYYPAALDALDAIDVPSVRYIRVPKGIEDDPTNVGLVRAAGYEAAISGRFVQWASADTEFTALGLVNNMELTVERRRERRPPECAAAPADP